MSHYKSPINIRNRSEIRTGLLIKLIASVALVFSGLLAFENIDQNSEEQQKVTEVTRQLSKYQAKIETLVNKNLMLTQGLAAFISINPDLTQKQYAQYAELLLERDHQIKNIGAAKDLVITHMYPLLGNEKALGTNYLDIPSQREAVLKAKESNEIVLAGPVNLVQGGAGLIARKPIFSSRTGQFWGMASVVLDYNEMLQLSGLTEQNYLNVAIKGTDSRGEEGEVFYGDPAIFENSPIHLKVALPYGEWIISAEPINGWGVMEIDLPVWTVTFILLLGWIFLLIQRANNQYLHARSIENLVESEEKFRNIFSNHNAVMLMIEQESGKIIDANAAAANFYGYTKQQLKNKDIQDINQLSAEEVANKRKLAVETNENYFIFPHQLANGDIKQVEVHSSPINLTDTNLLFSIIHDVTDRVEYEQKLKLDAQVFEHSREGVLITDASSKIISVNNAFTNITGYQEHEVKGCNPSILSSGVHDNTFYREMHQKIDEIGFWRGEIWNRKKDGSIYPQLLSISKLENEFNKITHYVAVFSDITQIKQSEKRLQNLAHYDVLTQLPNRLLLMTRIEHAVERVTRKKKEKLGILFLDLDQFKIINDSLGHIVGDELLCRVAERLTNSVRYEDTVARLGGDEFVVLIEDFDQPSDLATIAQHIIDELNKPFELSATVAHIGTSIGISIYPDDSLDPEKLISYADAAMYRAKDSGRNTYSFYTESITKEAEQKLHITNELKLAIENDELELFYQPQVCLQSGKVVGAEALLRWNHESGMIPPDRFIPLAEEKGLIHQITLWVIESGCKQLKEWQDQSLDLTLSLNVSARDWSYPNFFSSINKIIESTGVDCTGLEFELTENSIMDNADKVLAKIHKIKALGISLALDDFGTGHSSLAYLKHFPIDKLKIDKSFILELEKNPSDKMIISTIIDMAKNFNLKVIAEGIEYESHLIYLQSVACEMGQGYFFGKPMKIDEFYTFIDAQ